MADCALCGQPITDEFPPSKVARNFHKTDDVCVLALKARVRELEATNESLQGMAERLAHDAGQAHRRVVELEAQMRPIPFSERRPEKGRVVLVWDVGALEWVDRLWPELLLEKDVRLGYVTHWLPMPPAPQED